MRRLLMIALVAGAAATAPAHAQYLVSTGCQTGDWQAIEVSSGGKEIVEVCMSDSPFELTGPIAFTCRICPPIV